MIIAGAGVVALETAFALKDLACDQTDVSVLAPHTEFVYRPMTVGGPFAYGPARRYPLEPIIGDAGAQPLSGELGWVDPDKQTIHTKDEGQLTQR